MPALIAGRALQGLGGGAISSIAYVAVGRGYAEAVKPRMLALLSTAWVVPGLVGPGVSGIVAQSIGWRAVFLALAPLPVLAGLLALPSLRRMPAGVPSPVARTRTISAIVLALGAGLVLAGIGFPNPAFALSIAAAGFLLGIPAMQRLLPPGTLRAAPGMPATVATMGLLNLAFFGVDAFVPLGLVEVRGTSVPFAGFALTAATITWSTGSWIQARTATLISRRIMTRPRVGVAGNVVHRDDGHAGPDLADHGGCGRLGNCRSGHGPGLHHALAGHAGACPSRPGRGRLSVAATHQRPRLRSRSRPRRGLDRPPASTR